MAIYEVQTPNGQILEIEGPENADQNALLSFVAANWSPDTSAGGGRGAAVRQGDDGASYYSNSVAKQMQRGEALARERVGAGAGRGVTLEDDGDGPRYAGNVVAQMQRGAQMRKQRAIEQAQQNIEALPTETQTILDPITFQPMAEAEVQGRDLRPINARRTPWEGRLTEGDIPDMTATGLARDIGSGAAQIPGVVVSGAGQLGRLATGWTGHEMGKDLQKTGEGWNQTIQRDWMSDRARAQAAMLAQDMEDPAMRPDDVVLGNKGAIADMALPQVGSMLLPIGAAAGAARLAQAGNAAKLAGAIAPELMAARVGAAQTAAVSVTSALQNAAEAYSESKDKGAGDADAYKGAAIAAGATLLANKLTGGGIEAAIAKGQLGKGANVFERMGAVALGAGKEFAQEGGEGAGGYIGKQVALGGEIDANDLAKNVTLEGTMGALMGGGGHAVGAVRESIADAMASRPAPPPAPKVEDMPTTPQAPAPAPAPKAPKATSAQSILERESEIDGVPPNVSQADQAVQASPQQQEAGNQKVIGREPQAAIPGEAGGSGLQAPGVSTQTQIQADTSQPSVESQVLRPAQPAANAGEGASQPTQVAPRSMNVADLDPGQLLRVSQNQAHPMADAARQELKRREVEYLYQQREAQQQAQREADARPLMDEAADQQVAQADAVVNAASLEAPTAMAQAFAQAKAMKPKVTGLAAEMEAIRTRASNAPPPLASAGSLATKNVADSGQQEMADEFERLYQQDVKAAIQERLGLAPKSTATQADAKPIASPFRSFLREVGISSSLAADITGARGLKANNALPATFRKNGRNLDDLASLAVERGFLSQSDIDSAGDNGGTNKLVQMIQAEIRGERQQSVATASESAEQAHERVQRLEIEGVADSLGLQYSPDTSTDALATMVSRVQRRIEQANAPQGTTKAYRVQKMAIAAAQRIEQRRAAEAQRDSEYASLHIAEQNAYIDVIFDDDGTPIIVDKRAIDAELAAQQMAGKWSYQNERQTAATADQGTGQNPRETGPPVAGIQDKGAGDASQERGQAQRDGEAGTEEGLSSYTPAEVVARQDAQALAQRQDAAQQAAVEQRAQADAQRDEFTLTGSDRAADANPAQEGLKFSRAGNYSEAERQFKETERSYGGRDAYDRAKDAGKTRLTYRQWVQVRTPKFKAWFGDWEAVRARDTLQNMGAVPARLDAAFGPDFSQAKALAKNEFDKLREKTERDGFAVVAADGRKIAFSGRGFKEVAQHSADRRALSAAANLQALFESAVPLYSSKPDDVRQQVAAFHYYGVKADFGQDGQAFVMLEVIERSNGDFFYDADATSVEEVRAASSAPLADQTKSGAGGFGAARHGRLAQWVAGVNPQTVSKVVDPDTGEPLVVYHGTPGESFEVFDKSRIGSNVVLPASAPRGFYFAKDRQLSQKYGPNVIEAFVAGPVLLNNSRIVVVENPSQIKSATGNNGQFDPTNPDIRYSFAGSRAAAPSQTQDVADADQIVRRGSGRSDSTPRDLNRDVTLTIPIEGGGTAKMTVNAQTYINQLDKREEALRMVKECMA